jgi:hypothetical protein
MAQKFVQLNTTNGRLKQAEPVSTSAGAADAGKIPALNSEGKLDSTLLGEVVGLDTGRLMTAYETLSAGDFVNVFLDGGVPKLRKADASSDALMAHGFVKAAAQAGTEVKFYHCGVNGGLTGLVPGTTYFLSAGEPGGATAACPTASGHIVQAVGVALSETELQTNISEQPVTLA